MKIPNGMTEAEVLAKIQLVIDRIAPRYVFPGYDLADVKQEAFIICMSALDRYKEGFPLENFLSSNLSKRSKNLIRDRHYVKSDPEEKKRIKMPGQLSQEEYTKYYYDDTDRSIDVQALSDIIDRELPAKYRSNYLKMVNGVNVLKKDREELIEVIKKIANDNGYNEPEEGQDDEE